VFLQCSSVLRVANPSDRGLPTCERSPSFRATPDVSLWCSGWHATCRMYLWWDGRCSSGVDQICELSTDGHSFTSGVPGDGSCQSLYADMVM
jgi:hypothetical protein